MSPALEARQHRLRSPHARLVRVLLPGLMLVVLGLSACSDGDRQSKAMAPPDQPELDRSNFDESEAVEEDLGPIAPWSGTGAHDELLVFVGPDPQQITVAAADGEVLGSAIFATEVVVDPHPDVDRIVIRSTDNSTALVFDTSIGSVVGQVSTGGGPAAVYSGDGRFVAEIAGSEIEGQGTVTIRNTETAVQTFLAETEPGWIHDDGGAVFARSSSLVALPTFSPATNQHALFVVDAATSEFIGLTGPGPDDFLGWIGPSCWLSAVGDLARGDCVVDGSIERGIEFDRALIDGSAPFAPAQVSAAGIDQMALSVDATSDSVGQLLVITAEASPLDVGIGSFPRWSTSGRFLAAAQADQLVVLDPEGTVVATLPGGSGPPVWTASARS